MGLPLWPCYTYCWATMPPPYPITRPCCPGLRISTPLNFMLRICSWLAPTELITVSIWPGSTDEQQWGNWQIRQCGSTADLSGQDLQSVTGENDHKMQCNPAGVNKSIISGVFLFKFSLHFLENAQRVRFLAAAVTVTAQRKPGTWLSTHQWWVVVTAAVLHPPWVQDSVPGPPLTWSISGRDVEGGDRARWQGEVMGPEMHDPSRPSCCAAGCWVSFSLAQLIMHVL